MGLALLELIAHAQVSELSPSLGRSEGVDSSSQIQYVRFFLNGSSLPAVPPAPVASPSPQVAENPGPTLTAQCTRHPSGKLLFELFANFGGVDDLAYYPPWVPAGPDDLFPPRLEKSKITMEFLGYMHVKPVRREWEAVLRPAGQFRYSPPSTTSGNLEDSTYYLRFLMALPTLRLTLGPGARNSTSRLYSISFAKSRSARRRCCRRNRSRPTRVAQNFSSKSVHMALGDHYPHRGSIRKNSLWSIAGELLLLSA
ncbi:MAG: hypothetical protein M3Y50_05920 [Acidobacteriota bacterium]|nr:hypothetical protein [Acidobacteriota bacterium]